MTGSLVFPTRLFAPSSLQVRLVGQAITGGASLSGEVQFAEAAGGGRWVADFGEANLHTRGRVLAWRRFIAAADGGATPFLLPLADRRHQPLTNPYTGSDTFGEATWDDGLTAWTPSEVTATTSANAALGATSLSFAFTAPKRLIGGEHFSILHPTWGWRLYRVSRVVSGGLGSGDATTIEVRPPLREAAASGAQLNFESPRCLMRADGDIPETVSLLRFGKATARFVEWPGPAPT